MITKVATAAAPIARKVIHKSILDSKPLLYSPIIFSLDEILMIRKTSGTDATPFKTAVYIKALTGLMPIKLMINPMSVAIVIIP
jgi:hypothetical protein